MLKCAVFASGGGTNFQSLIDHKKSGELHADFALVVGNNSGAKAFERARANNIPVLHIAPSHFASEQEYTAQLSTALESQGIELIILAGYMKLLPVEIVRKYRNRIVNIHPALLPAFGGKGMYGHFVHEAVIAAGVKITGVTVHFVDEEYDHGAIIYQATVPVLDSDTPETLAQSVLKVEHDSYWRAIEIIAQGKYRIVDRRVICQYS
jgi:phosphoribosylglycinamide formyltransferase 1